MQPYTTFSLVQEIQEIPNIIRNIDISTILDLAKYIKPKVLLTGEGSSRIFPAKNTIYNSHKYGYAQNIFTEGATQSKEYILDGHTVFVASNSGKTKEGVALIRHLKTRNHHNIIGLVSRAGSPIVSEADIGFILSCQKENACAATKSVIEQALFYDILFRYINNQELPNLEKLGDTIEQLLKLTIPTEIVHLLKESNLFYWAGRNNGVAEELRLKSNEIVRVKSDYLEGTYPVHGIEEVMDSKEVIILVDPFLSEQEKYKEVLLDGVNIPIVTIGSQCTVFQDFIIPSYPGFDSYLQLCAGLLILSHIGYLKGINIDKPERARKVGNEFVG